MSSEMTQLPHDCTLQRGGGKRTLPGVAWWHPGSHQFDSIWHPFRGPRHGKSGKPILWDFLLKGLRFLEYNTRALLQGPKPPNERPKCSAIFQWLLRKKRKSSIQLRGQKNSFSQLHLHKYTGTLVDIQWKCPGPRPFFLHFSYGSYVSLLSFILNKRSPNQLEVFKLHFRVGKNQSETRVDSRVVPNTPH